ncbi:MAG: hypothetical protein ABIP06_06410, partial [Pyrinomonadaceae bacterium]
RNGASAISATPGPFYYSGAHMQAHAADGPLAALRAGPLATELNRVLGTSLAYQTPQLAGGMNTSAAAYATFLQRVMSDKLIMGQHLRAATVVTSGPGTSSPIPEPWLYGLGHWIEIDGTLSSPGAFGFYPWISADKALYGIVTRKNITGAWSSVTCGREIRKAFLATATPPAPPIPRPRPRRFVRL